MLTQLDLAKKRIITKEMQEVSRSEQREAEVIMKLVAQGKVVIPFNKNHKKLKPCGIGQGLRTKINANIGASPDCANIKVELEKVKLCEKYLADCVMDLSIGPKNLDEFRRNVIQNTYLPMGTVPIYQMVSESSIYEFEDKILEVLEKQAIDGVSFFTIHAGFKREFLKLVDKRVIGVVSRGGGILEKWMRKQKKENPLLTRFEEILELCRKYDVTLSLGDSLRPGCINDAGDKAQYAELKVLGDLTLRCRRAGVQVMIEGPGHVPLNKIKEQMETQKKFCHNAPFYVLGPLVCDIGAGYDHITAAIGGAVAGMYGADFLCYVTPAEHLRLPSLQDVRDGIIASKIAAHAADIAKGIQRAEEVDLKMSKARKAFNWKEQREMVFDKEKFDDYLQLAKEGKGSCTMCGEWCPMQNANAKAQKEEHKSAKITDAKARKE